MDVTQVVDPDELSGAGLRVTSVYPGDVRGWCLELEAERVELDWHQVHELRRRLTRWLNDRDRVAAGIRFAR